MATATSLSKGVKRASAKRKFNMPSSNKFHLFVSTTTVAAMYWVITHLSGRFPYVEKMKLYYRVPIVYLSSAGFYTLVAQSLRWLFEHSLLLRKLVLGPEFLEGTWIGCYKDPSSEKKYTVEHFEQTLDGVAIRGYAYNVDGTEHARWKSSSVAINAAQGVLTYSYECEVLAARYGFQGLAVFSFLRKRPGSAPRKMSGYSADLIDGVRSPNSELKHSDKQIPWADAFNEARKRFSE